MHEGNNKKEGRRAFLKGTLQALVVASAAAAAREPNLEVGEGETLWEDNEKPLPGEPGYRDPGAYGSDSKELAE